jgi:predicted nucleotidyltransferase
MLPEIESELQDLVRILKEEVPALAQVRVYGSYESGKWNQDKSDIDLVCITLDSSYSVQKDVEYLEYSKIENIKRRNLRKRIYSKFKGNYKDRISIGILTPGDLKKLWNYSEGRGPLGKNMLNGRLLYKNPAR